MSDKTLKTTIQFRRDTTENWVTNKDVVPAAGEPCFDKATVVAYVTDAIAALKIGDYAKAADLTALAGRVDTLEGTAHEHANKAVLDGITAEKITAWDGKADANHKHDIADLNQAAGYIVLNCGSASVNI